MRSEWVIVAVASLTIGVAFAGITHVDTPFYLFILTIAVGVTSSSLTGVVRARTGYLVALVLGLAVVGAIRFETVQDFYNETIHLLPPSNHEVVIRGVVCAEPDERETYTRLTVCVTQFDRQIIDRTARVLVSADRFTDVMHGHLIEVRGPVELPESYESHDAGGEFDYPNYLRVGGVTHTMSFPEIKVEDGHVIPSITGHLLGMKRSYLARIEDALPEPYAALGGGITVGAKRALGDSLLDEFRRTGLIHIVVLSGYNVAIILYALFALLGRTPRWIRFTAGGAAVIAFVIMTGAGAPIVRAATMAGLVIVAQELGRPALGGRLLALTAGGMILFNPYLLLFDPSFQLSVIATAGMIYVKPIIDRVVPFVTARLGLRDIVSATVATQVAVLPLLVHMTGDVSLVSVLANLLVLPVVPLAMLLVFMTAVIGVISYQLGLLIGFTAYAVLTYIITLVHFFSSWDFASVSVKPLPAFFMVLLYIGAASAIAMFHRSVERAETA
jgi:competence protein ComEC